MAITTEQIKELRGATGAGILDCRKALEAANGDFDKAVDYLREKGLAKAAKRADREASEGFLELYSHGNGRVGVMVEVNCETDFVSRSETFRTFAHEIALQIAAAAPLYIKAEDVPAEVLEHEGQIARTRALEEGKAEAVVDRLWLAVWRNTKMRFACSDSHISVMKAVTIEKLLAQNIGSIGENIVIRRFVRWEVGEGIAK